MEVESGRERQRSPAGESWVSMEGSQFDPNTFLDVGRLLSSRSQELGGEMRLTSETSSQTPATTTANASTGIYDVLPTEPPSAPRARSVRGKRIIFGFLAFVVVLFGTNVYTHRQNQAYQAEISTLREKVAKLEVRAASGSCPNEPTGPSGSSPSCSGNQLIDTCWFKVGWGDCAEDALKDPLKPLEDALGSAWDSTAEVIGVVTDTVVSDVRQVVDAMYWFGRYLLET